METYCTDWFFRLNGDVSTTSLTVDNSNSLITDGYDLTLTGGVTIGASSTLDASSGTDGATTMSVGGNWANSGTFTEGASVVTLSGSGTQTLTSGGANFYGLTISNTTANGVQLADPLIVTNALNIGASGLLDLENYAITATGATFSNDGTLKLQGGQSVTGLTVDTDSGTVYYDGSSTYTSFVAGTSYFNLTMGGSGTWTLQDNIYAERNVSVTNGTLDVGANKTITVDGTLTVDGGTIEGSANNVNIIANAINHTSGTIKTTTSGNITINSKGTVGAYTLGNITSAGTINIGQTTAPSSITQTAGTNIQSSDSNIRLRAVNDIRLKTINAGTSYVTVWSKLGAILDTTAPNATNITAYRVTMRAYDNIGRLFNPIEINATQLGGLYSVTGLTFVRQQQNSTTIDGINQDDPYRLDTDKSLSVDGLTVNGELIDLKTSFGDVTLGTLSVNGDMYIKAESGDIYSNGSFLSGTRITLYATGTIGTIARSLYVRRGNVRINKVGGNGVISACFSGNGRIIADAAPGIVLVNGNIHHVPQSVAGVLKDTNTVSSDQDEESSETIGGDMRDNYVNTAIQEVPVYETVSPHIDTSNYTLPNLNSFNLNLGASDKGKTGVTVSEHNGIKKGIKISKNDNTKRDLEVI